MRTASEIILLRLLASLTGGYDVKGSPDESLALLTEWLKGEDVVQEDSSSPDAKHVSFFTAGGEVSLASCRFVPYEISV